MHFATHLCDDRACNKHRLAALLSFRTAIQYSGMRAHPAKWTSRARPYSATRKLEQLVAVASSWIASGIEHS